MCSFLLSHPQMVHAFSEWDQTLKRFFIHQKKKPRKNEDGEILRDQLVENRKRVALSRTRRKKPKCRNCDHDPAVEDAITDTKGQSGAGALSHTISPAR